MKKHKNLVITLMVILALSIAILFFVKAQQKKKAQKLIDDAAKAALTPTGNTTTATPPYVANDTPKGTPTPVKILDALSSDSVFPLNVNSTGKAVAFLQVALNSPVTGVLTEKDKLKIKALGKNFPITKADLIKICFINGAGNYFPLKRGTKNKYVAGLQIMIGSKIDGVFGGDTEKLLKEFTNNTTMNFDTFFKMFRSTVVYI